MPIKWYGNGDSEDPIYKHFSRIVNFVIHCMIFTAIFVIIKKPKDTSKQST